MAKLSPLDASFLRMDTERTPMHVAGLMVFKLPSKAKPSYLRDLVDAFIESPVTLYPFNCRLKKGGVGGSLSWVKEKNIDMGHHVRHSSLPWPGGEKELGMLVARLHSNPLDLRRPPWELHVIEGLERKRFALYVKIHHGAIDGMGAMRLLTRWLKDQGAEQDRQDGIAPWSMHRSMKNPRGKGSSSSKSNLSKSLKGLQEQSEATVELAKNLYKMTRSDENPDGGFSSALKTPKTRFNVPVTPQRRLATQLLDMRRFKAIGKATGTTVNDVSLAVIGSATRRYLEELEALPKDTLVASVPLAVENEDPEVGNSVVGFVCPLATDEKNVLTRLKVIHSVTTKTKSQLQDMSKESLKQFSLLGVAPVMLGQMSGLGAKIPPVFNFVVSNVIAPQEKLYLEGAELEALYPVSLLFDGYALNITLVGYADKISMGFVGCRSANPSLQRLAVYTGEALDELEALVFSEKEKNARRAAQKHAEEKKSKSKVVKKEKPKKATKFAVKRKMPSKAKKADLNELK